MSETLTFPDGESVADLATFVARARRLEQEGAIRLQAVGEVLAAWVCVLPGQGVLRSGIVLGLRTMRLSGPHQLEVTVPLAGLADRFARRAATADVSTTLAVPPSQVSVPWAAVTPPRGGWEPVGSLPVADLEVAARAGITEVAEGAPEGSGSAAVAALRQRVWARPVADGEVAAQVPSGVALAVDALGFGARATEASVHRSGPWVRLSLPSGHVLARP